MASTNLKNGNKGRDTDSFTHQERIENGRKGGIKSGEVKRARKQMRETIALILDMPLKSKNGKLNKKSTVEQIKSLEDVKNHNPDVQTAILLAIAKKALAGDVVAATFLRDTSGENPYIVAEKEKQLENGYTEQEQINDATDIVFKVREDNIYEQQEEVITDDANTADNTESENNRV